MTTALPREIRKAIRKKRAKRIFLFLSATILTAVIIAIWGDTIFPFPEGYTALKYSCYAVLLILPFFYTKVYLIFTDFNYIGKIKKVKVVSLVDNKSAAKPTREQLYRKNEMTSSAQPTARMESALQMITRSKRLKMKKEEFSRKRYTKLRLNLVRI